MSLHVCDGTDWLPVSSGGGGEPFFTFTEDGTKFPADVLTAKVPSFITEIGKWAFQGCSSLASIDLPAEVTSIGEQTFGDCIALTSINLPAGVTSIGEGAFRGCLSLTSINLPAGVTSIGAQTFVNCIALTSINLPAGVTSIGEYAFDGCEALALIVCRAVDPPTVNEGALPPGVATVQVPAGSVDAYKQAYGWSAFAANITAIP